MGVLGTTAHVFRRLADVHPKVSILRIIAGHGIVSDRHPSPFAIAMYLPAFPTLGQEFGVPSTMVSRFGLEALHTGR